MAIEFICRHCGVDLSVPDGAAGKAGRCSNCGRPVRVPAAEPIRAAPAPADEQATDEHELAPPAGRERPSPGPASQHVARRIGRHLKPHGALKWLGGAAVRLIVLVIAAVGLYTLERAEPLRNLSHTVESAMREGIPGAPRAWLAGAASRRGAAGRIHRAAMGLAGVLLIWGGLRGALLRANARAIMLLGAAIAGAADAGYAALPYLPAAPAWLKAGLPAPHWAGVGLRLAIYGAAALWLLSARGAFRTARADAFANVAGLVDRILEKALQTRSSDVHIEPTGQGVLVRFRIDGMLHAVATYPPRALTRIVSRIKVMGNMDIAERRAPQDGSASVRIGQRSIDLRIATVPSQYGERAAVRILDRQAGLRGLQALGMAPELLDQVQRIVSRPHGTFFCTGPTGSGKTTTLYAALLHIKREERNVITVEDPIEYHLHGITQLPVGTKKGMTFAGGVRSILRQDPDVIMVGEVRDRETAQMVMEAAQTGHLVLSTLHTNDAAGAVGRLLDLGVEPSLLASSLAAVLAQRLVRCICSACAVPYRPAAEELKSVGMSSGTVATLRRGSGCVECMGTGYRGRIGLFELLIVDRELRRLIGEHADAATMHDHAVAAGMVTLREDGRRKVLAGITTIEDVGPVAQAVTYD